jgi:hypothetical protein
VPAFGSWRSPLLGNDQSRDDRRAGQRPVVGPEREAAVEPIASVGAVDDPVASRNDYRSFEPRPLESSAHDLHDRAYPAISNDRAGTRFYLERAGIGDRHHWVASKRLYDLTAAKKP